MLLQQSPVGIAQMKIVARKRPVRGILRNTLNCSSIGSACFLLLFRQEARLQEGFTPPSRGKKKQYYFHPKLRFGGHVWVCVIGSRAPLREGSQGLGIGRMDHQPVRSCWFEFPSAGETRARKGETTLHTVRW